MLNFFEENFSDDAILLKPNNWLLNIPNLNPMNFGIWSIFGTEGLRNEGTGQTGLDRQVERSMGKVESRIHGCDY